MLLELRIRDLAIIEDLRVQFAPGLNVLSGETGAGKSILVDALGLVVGGRAAPDLVRAGAEAAVVEALFRVDARPDVRERLEAQGLEARDEMVIRRSVAAEGKGRAWVNGSPVTQAMLAGITDALVEIHGQHEHQRLLRRDFHLDCLDRAAGLLESRARMSEAARCARDLGRERDALSVSVQDRLREIDLLRFQVDEIRKADPQPGEDARLDAERARLTHAARLAEIATGAEAGLYSGEGAAVDSLGRVAAALREGARLDPALGAGAERVEGALREVEDVAADLRGYAERGVFDPERLAEVDARLEILRRLTRKHGPGIEAVLAAQAAAEERLALLEGHDERLAAIEKACARAEDEGRARARELSAARRRAARGRERKVREELSALGMAQAAFEVRFDGEPPPPPGFGERGADRLEFLFSPNPGEPPRPLARVASGGELARTMLALQNVLAAGDVPTTFVFDEADAGVGGRLADAVGRRLADLAAGHQVLCITHLPQIAARGAWHLRVIKEPQGSRTVARVERLEGEARVEEVARMSGGAQVTETTRAHARDLLSRGARDAREGSGRQVLPASEGKARERRATAREEGSARPRGRG